MGLKRCFIVLSFIVLWPLFAAGVVMITKGLIEKKKEKLIGGSLVSVVSICAIYIFILKSTLRQKILTFFQDLKKSKSAKKIASFVSLILLWAFNFYLLFSNITQSFLTSNEINLPNWIFDENEYEKTLEETKKNGLIPSYWNSQYASITGFIIILSIFPLYYYMIILVEKCKGFLKETREWIKFFFGMKTSYYIYCFHFFEQLYFALSLVGIALAIGYPKSGTFLSLVATVEIKVHEKIINYLKDKEKKRENEPSQMEKEKEDESLNQMEAGLKPEENLELKKETNEISEIWSGA
ncbi:hypothetical protein RhiirA4_421739 [Rhizophagus irregularis]|uniref:Uncharacterized protein n=1 Tax=Rhizophagus irregularis TaxID=588596 RepID=A0A2I1GMJ6_9GLOM|nr:hypothetical protein RhiirA4_421739 [Rhizophagus irregularis]